MKIFVSVDLKTSYYLFQLISCWDSMARMHFNTPPHELMNQMEYFDFLPFAVPVPGHIHKANCVLTMLVYVLAPSDAQPSAATELGPFNKWFFARNQNLMENLTCHNSVTCLQSQQIFAHAMIAWLSCHEVNIVPISLFEAKHNFFSKYNWLSKTLSMLSLIRPCHRKDMHIYLPVYIQNGNVQLWSEG